MTHTIGPRRKRLAMPSSFTPGPSQYKYVRTTHSHTRYPRTTVEAFQSHEAWPSVQGPYRAPLLSRMWPAITRVVAVALIFGALGALLGWGGR